MIKEKIPDGYCVLDSKVAVELADEILDQDPLQQPVDAEKVKGDFSKQMKRLGGKASKRKAAS